MKILFLLSSLSNPRAPRPIAFHWPKPGPASIRSSGFLIAFTPTNRISPCPFRKKRSRAESSTPFPSGLLYSKARHSSDSFPFPAGTLWVAAQAAKLTGIAHVTTVHQPLPVHFFSKLFPCLGDQTIAIDEAVADHLRRHFGRPAEKIHLIRNGINLAQNAPTARQMPNMKQVLLIGRLFGRTVAGPSIFLGNLGTMRTQPAARPLQNRRPNSGKNGVRRLRVSFPSWAPI